MSVVDLFAALEKMGYDTATEGRARQTHWVAKDGWMIVYTTNRIKGGKDDGKFAVMAYKPVGKGARGGRKSAQSWERVYYRAFAKRKSARDRAEQLYWKHHLK